MPRLQFCSPARPSGWQRGQSAWMPNCRSTRERPRRFPAMVHSSSVVTPSGTTAWYTDDGVLGLGVASNRPPAGAGAGAAPPPNEKPNAVACAVAKPLGCAPAGAAPPPPNIPAAVAAGGTASAAAPPPPNGKPPAAAGADLVGTKSLGCPPPNTPPDAAGAGAGAAPNVKPPAGAGGGEAAAPNEKPPAVAGAGAGAAPNVKVVAPRLKETAGAGAPNAGVCPKAGTGAAVPKGAPPKVKPDMSSAALSHLCGCARANACCRAGAWCSRAWCKIHIGS